MTADEFSAIRQRLKLTQAELAVRLGVSRVTVARWESGLRTISEPVARLLRLLAKPEAKRLRGK